ncbi:hypothetical protein [Nocardioides cavernaquae]|uniref:Uncharacterized protein n=1 Tax=Nocardioides cavernaquae TaxID=2321396 RepID=A0A3A5H328_9ACTN|nr:hypothetical protein [Nocardioides cavernaquae]RJS45193.1 hypothetical protein D4739_02415 [Nocardioides cavernaquae]
MSNSMIYTMGTALDRAHEAGALVQCLVQGQWLGGSVMAVDGHGIVLARGDNEHVVVRLEDVSALRVQGALPGAQDASPAFSVLPTTRLPRVV